MFHLIVGTHTLHGSTHLISNTMIGIEAVYQGTQSEGTFYLYPTLDDRTKTINYYAFDTMADKQVFGSLLKINGIGPKTAYALAHLPHARLKQAVEEFDLSYISAVPGIGPKSAKKILVQLKDTLKTEDVAKLTVDAKLLKSLTTTLKQFGYTSAQINAALPQCPHPLNTDNAQDIVKWLVQNMK